MVVTFSSIGRCFKQTKISGFFFYAELSEFSLKAFHCHLIHWFKAHSDKAKSNQTKPKPIPITVFCVFKCFLYFAVAR